MPPAPPSRYDPHAAGRDRVVALSAAVAITALLLWMLLRLGILPEIVRRAQTPTIMSLLPGEQSEQATAAPRSARPASGSHAAAARRQPVSTPPSPVPPPPPPVKTPVPWNVLPLSGAEFAAADIGSKPHSSAPAAAGQGEGQQAGDGDDGGSSGSGQGAGADRLYPVDWYRRPTRAEMAPYLDTTRRSGWGEIACRTIADYRVEDCRELQDTPGSGISRALRQAAWQFRVLPPRVGHHAQIGTWVVIHWDIGDLPPAG